MLERELGSGRSRYHEARFAEQQSGRATYLIAWRGDNPVGHLLLKWHGADDPAVQVYVSECPELNAIGVRPDLQSQGIGTSLIRRAEDLVRTRGYGCVGLAVGVENHRARKLYEQLGYRDWERGTFETSWRGMRDDGTTFVERETCTYLLRHLG
jgi:ribosomal protein S18 acetylase RimI-like enzyme